VTEAAQFRPHITAAAVMLLLSAVVILLAGLKRNVKICFACFVLFPLLLVNVNYPILNVVFSAKSARALAHQMSTLPPQTELACLECFPSGLTFYLGRTLTLITTDGSELTSNYIAYRLKTENPWPTNLVSAEQLDKWLASRNYPVYLLAKEGDRPRLETIAAGRGAAVQQLTPFYIGVLLPPP
jgi:hypothetical protein